MIYEFTEPFIKHSLAIGSKSSNDQNYEEITNTTKICIENRLIYLGAKGNSIETDVDFTKFRIKKFTLILFLCNQLINKAI